MSMFYLKLILRQVNQSRDEAISVAEFSQAVAEPYTEIDSEEARIATEEVMRIANEQPNINVEVVSQEEAQRFAEGDPIFQRVTDKSIVYGNNKQKEQNDKSDLLVSLTNDNGDIDYEELERISEGFPEWDEKRLRVNEKNVSFRRLQSEANRGYSMGGRLLQEASCVASCLRTTDERSKGISTEEARRIKEAIEGEYAKRHWVELNDSFYSQFTEDTAAEPLGGAESLVYISKDKKKVTKLLCFT